MIKFDKDKVLLLHQLITQETGGSAGVRDFGLLDAALESAYRTFDGKELFPTKEEKAARIGIGLVTNHAFVDGNKRIGLYIMITFLEANGIKIEATNDEIIKVGLSLAQGEMKYEDLLKWIIEHKV
jgi:death-on-curing protein